MSTWPSPISSASSEWLAQNPNIWLHSPNPHLRKFVQASTASSIPSRLLNMRWRSSAALSQTATSANALTGSIDLETRSGRSSSIEELCNCKRQVCEPSRTESAFASKPNDNHPTGDRMPEIAKRLEPKKEVLRELFLKSGNLCAFPGCERLMLNIEGVFYAYSLFSK